MPFHSSFLQAKHNPNPSPNEYVFHLLPNIYFVQLINYGNSPEGDRGEGKLIKNRKRKKRKEKREKRKEKKEKRKKKKNKRKRKKMDIPPCQPFDQSPLEPKQRDWGVLLSQMLPLQGKEGGKHV